MPPNGYASETMRRRLAALLLCLSVAACGDSSGDSEPSDRLLHSVRHWTEVAIDASGRDHTPVSANATRVYVTDGPVDLDLPHAFGEQLGPGRAARAIAIVAIAVFEAINAVEGEHASYLGLEPAAAGTSREAAMAQAARDTLAALFPSQTSTFDAELAIDLAAIEDGRTKSDGIELGMRAAASILALRANDGSDHDEPRVGIEYLPGTEPGDWQPDPISQHPLALGARWDQVTPFVLQTARQFRIPPPPTLDSAEYAAAFDEAATLGGDGLTTPTTRTEDQTEAGIFWAYDGTPSLCAPPRLYNQIALQIAEQQGTDGVELARLLALVNVAMADAGIAIWESKYHYEFWRPVSGIRDTTDPSFMPLGAPASNLTGPNFTPPFPAYPSGHAGFGAALFEVLRNFYGTDDIAFTFVSDEYNGATVDNQGNVRPLKPRTFSTFSEAEEENGQSRIYLGIHWSFDKTEGIALGRDVGDYVYDRLYPPVPATLSGE
jgi:hypothetical protein